MRISIHYFVIIYFLYTLSQLVGKALAVGVRERFLQAVIEPGLIQQ